MGYDIDAYYSDEYASIQRVPGWDLGWDNRSEEAEIIATYSDGARSNIAEALFKALHAEEFDGKVSGNAGARYFVRPQIIEAIEYIALRIREEPRLVMVLEFFVKILVRLNRADAPGDPVVWIWFC